MLKCWFLLQKEKGIGDTQFRIYSCRYFGCNLFASHGHQEERTAETRSGLGWGRGQRGRDSCHVHNGNRIILSQRIGLLKLEIFNAGVSFLMQLHL